MENVYTEFNNYIITLQKLPDTITNEHLLNRLFDNEHGTYNGTKFLIIRIEDKNGKEIDETSLYGIKYEKNKIIEVEVDKISLEFGIAGIFYIKNKNDLVMPSNYTGHKIIYYRSGRVDTEYDLINGVLNGHYKKYYQNGTIKSDTNFVESNKQNHYIDYYDNGNVCKEFDYIDNIIEGNFIKYHFKGRKAIECTYKHGLKIGKCIYYNRSGDIKKICEYENGKLKKKTCSNFIRIIRS